MQKVGQIYMRLVCVFLALNFHVLLEDVINLGHDELCIGSVKRSWSFQLAFHS